MFQDSQKAPNVVTSQHPLFPPSNLVGEGFSRKRTRTNLHLGLGLCAFGPRGHHAFPVCLDSRHKKTFPIWKSLDRFHQEQLTGGACHAAAATDFSRPVPGGSTEL